MELVREIAEEIKTSYLDYAMSVIVGRALPDVRDGLKPVQRRILYSMYEMGLFSNRNYRKSARIVGDVLGKYHPHGDAAVYEALVRMAQDFNMRYPLIDGQGNFGSIDGDEPAAMRYTEARLTKIAEEMLRDIDKDTVDFVPNFDNTLKEPSVLPSAFPNLLANGSSGIAVGMATNIPPHNLREICDAIIEYIRNPDVTVRELMKYVKGPDFPTGGIIVGVDGIIKAYETGRGRIILRGKVEFEDNAIIIKEVPYTVRKSLIVEKIANLVKEGKLEEVKAVRDESDREGIRVVVELKSGVDKNLVLKKLYLYTPLQITYSIMLLALVNTQPKVLTLKDLIAEYVNHRREVVRRRTTYELEKAEERIHVLEGFKIVISNLDEAISLIRSSKSPSEAKERLISRFSLSEKQADAVLQMRLQKLTSMEIEGILKEYEELDKKIRELKSILASQEKMDEIIIKELEEIKKNYGDDRRTKIVEKYEEITEVDTIKDENNVLIITKDGFAKRLDESDFRVQRRGGVGISGISLRDGDYAAYIVKVRSLDRILLFTKDGKAFSINAYEIPKQERSGKGVSLKRFLRIEDEIVGIVPFEKGNVVILTESGYIKKVNIAEFENAKRSGILASPESVAFVKKLDGNEIVIATENGRLVRFKAEEVPEYKRNARGVKAISLEGDKIAWMDVGSENLILTLTENGYGKRTKTEEFRLTGRGAKGVIAHKVNEKTGRLVFAEFVKSDKLMVVSKDGNVVVVEVKQIPVMGRNAIGVTVSKKGIISASFI